MEQQLARLRLLLDSTGLEGLIDQQILYPGQRRQQVLRGLMSSLLGGASIDEVPVTISVAPEGLSEDERFAERCRVLLQMLNLQASTERIRGCSGNQQQDTALLIQIAELLQAMNKQRSKKPSKQQSAAPYGSIQQLLCTASQSLGQLTSSSLQLFASDMTDVLKVYSDQGALQQQSRLQQQVSDRLQQLKQQLQQTSAAGGSNCEGADGQEWQQQIAQAERVLDELLKEVQNLHRVYQQELSVWADVAAAPDHTSPVGGLHAADNTLQAADSVGQAAQRIVVAYQGLTAALDGFGGVMKQHQALQDVPAGMLQEQRAAHQENARQLRQMTACLKPVMKA